MGGRSGPEGRYEKEDHLFYNSASLAAQYTLPPRTSRLRASENVQRCETGERSTRVTSGVAESERRGEGQEAAEGAVLHRTAKGAASCRVDLRRPRQLVDLEPVALSVCSPMATGVTVTAYALGLWHSPLFAFGEPMAGPRRPTPSDTYRTRT